MWDRMGSGVSRLWRVVAWVVRVQYFAGEVEMNGWMDDARPALHDLCPTRPDTRTLLHVCAAAALLLRACFATFCRPHYLAPCT